MTVLDFAHAQKKRYLERELPERIEGGLNEAVAILTADAAEIDARLQMLPPEYREYVETGNTDGIRRLYAELGIDDSDFEFMADMAVKMVNIASERLG